MSSIDAPAYPPPAQLGSWLRNLRERAGILINDIALELDVNRRTVSRWEQGQTEIPGTMLLRYLQAVGVTLPELPELGGIDSLRERLEQLVVRYDDALSANSAAADANAQAIEQLRMQIAALQRDLRAALAALAPSSQQQAMRQRI